MAAEENKSAEKSKLVEESVITIRVIRPSGGEILEAALHGSDKLGLLVSKTKDALGGLHFICLIGEQCILDNELTIAEIGLEDGDFVTAVAGDLEAALSDAKLRLSKALEELGIARKAGDDELKAERNVEKAKQEVGRFKGLARAQKGGWDILVSGQLADIDLAALFSELRGAWEDGENLHGLPLDLDQSMQPLLNDLAVKLVDVALKEAQKPGGCSQEAVRLLARWEELYLETRSDLERSGGMRWEFDRISVLKPVRDAIAQIQEGHFLISPNCAIPILPLPQQL